MHFEYETSRLLIKIVDENSAKQVLEFYKEGDLAFAPLEPAKQGAYFTESYQAAQISAESKAFLSGVLARYYFMKAEEPNRIIGTVSFSHILKGAYQSCILGYKLLPSEHKHGYATEAVSRLITAIFEENNLHRIEAYTLPDNYDSIGLLLRLGFSFESIARSFIRLEDGFADHNRYVLLNPLHQ